MRLGPVSAELAEQRAHNALVAGERDIAVRLPK